MKRFYRVGAIALFLIMLSAYVSADLNPFKWMPSRASNANALAQDSTIVLEDRAETWQVMWLIKNYQTDSTSGDTINCQWAKLKEHVELRRLATSKSLSPLIEVETPPVNKRKTTITVVLPLKQTQTGEERTLKVSNYPFEDETELLELLDVVR